MSATLDAGTYDCAAYLVVPADLTSFTYTADYDFSQLDTDGRGEAEHRYHKFANNGYHEIKPGEALSPAPESVVVILPPFSRHEWEVATTDGAAPTPTSK